MLGEGISQKRPEPEQNNGKGGGGNFSNTRAGVENGSEQEGGRALLSFDWELAGMRPVKGECAEV